jgi:tRNA U34 2-thiouridine synthase MnmA/TrmU
LDLSQNYWLDVFEPSIMAWQTGQTPNPDVACNTHVKFGELARRVLGPERGLREGEAQGGEGKGWLVTGKP